MTNLPMGSAALDVDRVDDVFDVLRNRRRRFVLADLDGRSPPVDLGDLAERLTVAELDLAESAPGPTVERVQIELHHRHLPILTDAGLLTYRPPETRVVDWPDFDLPDGWCAAPSPGPLLAAMRSE